MGMVQSSWKKVQLTATGSRMNQSMTNQPLMNQSMVRHRVQHRRPYVVNVAKQRPTERQCTPVRLRDLAESAASMEGKGLQRRYQLQADVQKEDEAHTQLAKRRSKEDEQGFGHLFFIRV